MIRNPLRMNVLVTIMYRKMYGAGSGKSRIELGNLPASIVTSKLAAITNISENVTFGLTSFYLGLNNSAKRVL